MRKILRCAQNDSPLSLLRRHCHPAITLSSSDYTVIMSVAKDL